MSPLRPAHPFTGRSALLAELDSMLAPRGHRPAVVALHGLGGVGKTDVAAAVYRRHQALRPDDLVWWVDAGDGDALADGYAALASELQERASVAGSGSVSAGDVPDEGHARREAARGAVLAWLQANGGWLIVFDGAEGPEALRRYLPRAGPGSVLITSRHAAWAEVGNSEEVPPFHPGESLDYLLAATGQHDRRAASDVARELGHLPLALAQAVDHMLSADLTLAQYLALFRADPEAMLDKGVPPGHMTPIARVWTASIEAVHAAAPPAEQLLRLLSFLAPERLDLGLVVAGWHAIAPDPDHDRSSGPEHPAHRAVQVLRRHSLVQTAPRDTVTMHRLLQTVIRAGLAPGERSRLVEAALGFAAAAFPRGFEVPDRRVWQTCARLVPHATAVAGHARAYPALLAAAAELLGVVGWFRCQLGRLRAARSDLEEAVRLAVTGGADAVTLAELRRRLALVSARIDGCGDARGG